MRLGDVDATQRQADPLGVGQQRLGSVEGDPGLTVGHRDRDRGVLGQCGPVGRGQPGLQPYRVVAAVAEPGDAEVLAARLHAVVHRGIEGDETVQCVALAPRQRRREGEAGGRDGAVGLDRDVEVLDGLGWAGQEPGHDREKGRPQDATPDPPVHLSAPSMPVLATLGGPAPRRNGDAADRAIPVGAGQGESLTQIIRR